MQHLFLQSAVWQDFQRRLGRTVHSFSDDAYVVKLDLPFGKNYLYTPSPHILDLWNDIRKVARVENSMFLKCEPFTEDPAMVRRLASAGFQESLKALQPQRTSILDIRGTLQEVLAGMYKKTRYNIRVAERKYLDVRISEKGSHDREAFWKMLQETATRDGFRTHPRRYYEELLRTEGAELYFAYKESVPISVAIIFLYENRASYLHGASDYDYRECMGPYALQWYIIEDLQNRGITEYDLWGIDEKRWPGVTRFKKRFGGRTVQYIGSFDYPFQKLWYRVYRLRNEIRH